MEKKHRRIREQKHSSIWILVIVIIIASFVFTYMAFEINCRIVIFLKSIKANLKKIFLRNK